MNGSPTNSVEYVDKVKSLCGCLGLTVIGPFLRQTRWALSAIVWATVGPVVLDARLKDVIRRRG